MEFLNVNIFWNLVWLIPLFLLIIIVAFRKRKRFIASILGKRHTNPEYVSLSLNKRILRLWLLALALILILIGAARPFWGYKLLPFSGSGRDILAVIDVSKSMLSKDIQPSRLDHAKHLLQDLINNTPGDRYGIIAFAGSAFLECPLTINRTSLYTTLKDIDTNSIPVGGTNIEGALRVSINAFKAAAGGYKAIIIITDGDQLQGNIVNVIGTLKKIKIPLLVIGIGDPSKPGLIQLSSKNGQSYFLRDSQGNLVKSKLNEPLLEDLAKATNGIYIRSTAVDPGLNILQKRIAQLIPQKYKNGQLTRPLEKFQIPLFAAILLVFLWLAIGERKTKGKTYRNKKNSASEFLIIIAFSGCILLVFNSAQAQNPGQNQKPNLAKSNDQDKLSAASQEKNTQKKDQTENSPTTLFNMGVEKQLKGDPKKAQAYYTKAINLANNDNIRSKAYQNLGVLEQQAARKIIMQNPEETLKLLKRAEILYKEGMRIGDFRKNLTINQQILLNDRKKAEEIIKKQKEMQQKRNKARQKTQEALDKQKQANSNKKQKEKQQQQKEADQKTKDAQKAIQDYKKSAEQNQSQKDKQDAQGAENDINKAQKNQKQGSNKKAEQNLKQAMEKLKNQNNQQNQQQNQQQQKQQMENKKNQTKQKIEEALDKQREANNTQDKRKKQQRQKEANKKTQEAQKANDDYKNSADQNNSQQDKQKAEETSRALKNAEDSQQKNNGEKAEKELKKALDNIRKKGQNPPKKLPPQPKAQPVERKYDNKDIDPKQAESLLKLMTKDELKKRQKKAYANTKVNKDW